MMENFEFLIKSCLSNSVPFRTIESLIVKAPKSPSGVGVISSMPKGDIVAFTSGTKCLRVNQFLVDGEYIFMNDGGQADIKYYNGKAYYSDHVFVFTSKVIRVRYLFHYLQKISRIINSDYFRGGGIKNLVKKQFLKIKIPVPSTEIQDAIVDFLDQFCKIDESLKSELIDRKKQYEYYLNKLLKIKNFQNYPIKTVGELFVFKNGINKEKSAFGRGTPIINFTDVFHKRYLMADDVKGLVTLSQNEIDRYKCEVGDVFFTRTSETIEEIGMSSTLVEPIEKCVFSGFVLRARPLTDSLMPKFCSYYFSSKQVRNYIVQYASFTTRATTTGGKLSKIPVPIIPKEKQKEIVEFLDLFDSLIKLEIPKEIEARQKQYEYYRDKLLMFKELKA